MLQWGLETVSIIPKSKEHLAKMNNLPKQQHNAGSPKAQGPMQLHPFETRRMRLFDGHSVRMGTVVAFSKIYTMGHWISQQLAHFLKRGAISVNWAFRRRGCSEKHLDPALKRTFRSWINSRIKVLMLTFKHILPRYFLNPKNASTCSEQKKQSCKQL